MERIHIGEEEINDKWLKNIKPVPKTESDKVEKAKQILGFPLTKEKKYVKNPSDAPKGADVKQGPQGGYYYTDTPDKPDTEDDSKAKRIEYVVSEYEKSIMHQDYESCGVVNANGEMIFTKDGGKDYITFTKDEMEKFTGTVFTHNHPKGSSFSNLDIQLACENNIKEVRVIGSNEKSYSLSREDGTNLTKELWDYSIRYAYASNTTEVQTEFFNAIRKGTMTIEEANGKHYNEVWTRVAKAVPSIIYKGD